MDTREPLPIGARLSFPGMECTIHSLAGKGSNSFVYEGGYPDNHDPELSHRVLIKELFPYHPRGAVFRTPSGEIEWRPQVSEIVALHKTSFQRGNEVHLRLLQTFPSEIGANLNTFPVNHTLYTVLGFSGGRSLESELASVNSAAMSIGRHIRRMLGAADALEIFHNSGYLHLDISPDNILLTGDGKGERVSLIDYNTVHTIQELRTETAFYCSEKEGYTAPEILAGDMQKTGFCSDLYSLTSVFYRCIAGRSLTVLETSQSGAPDISELPCVKGLPETALSMLRHILRRGLAVVPKRRYQTVAKFKHDLEELQDRIDGKGITHWALWESGRADINRIIKKNPAFSYIRETDSLYPLRCSRPDGTPEDFQSAFRKMRTPEGKSIFLLGGGGIGKTTAVLSAAFRESAVYSPAEPAISYIPLYGWNGNDANYIKDKLLQVMLFKPHTTDMEMARHELLQLLSTPAYTKLGERTRTILILDGLNEAGGDTAPLIAEINELSSLPGLRVCLTSRTYTDLPAFQTVHMSSLAEQDVRDVLSVNGLIAPEDPVMRESLQTPIMLSLYVRAAKEEKAQLQIHTRDELMDAYFSSMIQKAIVNEESGSNARWRAQAAVCYVLPMLAKAMRRQHGGATDQQLLPTVERCWKRLSTKGIRRAFPEWIGHISSIRGEAKDAEAWYGEIVHELLWRKMGLIIRDSQGNYRLFHSFLEDFLLARHSKTNRHFMRAQLSHGLVTALAVCSLFILAYQTIFAPYIKTLIPKQPQPYNVEQTENILGSAFSAFFNSSHQCSQMLALLDSLNAAPLSTETYLHNRAECIKTFQERDTIKVDFTLSLVDDLMKTGEVMPFSGEPLNREELENIMRMGDTQAEVYRQSIETLDFMLSNPQLWQQYGSNYLKELSVAVDADLEVIKKRYEIVLEPEYSTTMDALAMITPLAIDSIQTYERIQFVAWNAVSADPIHTIQEKGH